MVPFYLQLPHFGYHPGEGDQYGCPAVTRDGLTLMPQAKSGMTLGQSQIRDDDPDLYVLQHDAKAAKQGWLVGTFLFRHTLSVEHKVKHEDNYEEV
jgi:hypothetical protein